MGAGDADAGWVGVCAHAAEPDAARNRKISVPHRTAGRCHCRVNCMFSAPLRPKLLLDIGLFPLPDALASLVENPLVVAAANLEARVRRELPEDGRPHVEDGEVWLGSGRRDGVAAEQKSIG